MLKRTDRERGVETIPFMRLTMYTPNLVLRQATFPRLAQQSSFEQSETRSYISGIQSARGAFEGEERSYIEPTERTELETDMHRIRGGLAQLWNRISSFVCPGAERARLGACDGTARSRMIGGSLAYVCTLYQWLPSSSSMHSFSRHFFFIPLFSKKTSGTQ